MTQSERNKANRDAGLCNCGGKREFLSASCKKCIDRHKAYNDKKHAEKLKARVSFSRSGRPQSSDPLPPTNAFHRSRRAHTV